MPPMELQAPGAGRILEHSHWTHPAIFVANFYGSVSELLGLAKPVMMPVQKNLPP
jgi:hypothetical protein